MAKRQPAAEQGNGGQADAMGLFIRIDSPKALPLNTRAIADDNGGLVCVMGQLEGASDYSIDEVWAETRDTAYGAVPATPPAGAKLSPDTTPDNHFYFHGSGASCDGQPYLRPVSTPGSVAIPYYVYVWIKVRNVPGYISNGRQFQFKIANSTDCGCHDP